MHPAVSMEGAAVQLAVAYDLAAQLAADDKKDVARPGQDLLRVIYSVILNMRFSGLGGGLALIEDWYLPALASPFDRPNWRDPTFKAKPAGEMS